MDPRLEQETLALERSWMRHEAGKLREYLVSGVEDPRINLQSIFSRHFILRALFGEKFTGLMDAECRFSAVMNWLMKLVRRNSDADSILAVVHALRVGSDNAEGIEIPQFVVETARELRKGDPAGGEISDYIEAFLTISRDEPAVPMAERHGMNTFVELWRRRVEAEPSVPRLSVVEPACGSANDYRYLEAFGIANRIDYTGFDLCEKNVVNARTLHPGTRFERGNVFRIQSGDRFYDLCIVHDLFEHLSPGGLEAALDEVCRVTRSGLCLGFFSMDESPGTVIRPMDEYHWNTLSMERVKEALASRGFASRVLHVGTFLQKQVGCEDTHNPTAYTFISWRT